jgi:hypothetical protein
MKKVILAIVGMMVLVGNAHARCGIDSDQWGSCAEYGNCGNMRKCGEAPSNEKSEKKEEEGANHEESNENAPKED